jgi:uncharacterized coiled-coil protein SlyX
MQAIMSTINSVVHHTDQLLTQHRQLQMSHTQLQARIAELEHQLAQQQQIADTLAQSNDQVGQQEMQQAIEADLTYLIGLFDKAEVSDHE